MLQPAYEVRFTLPYAVCGAVRLWPLWTHGGGTVLRHHHHVQQLAAQIHQLLYYATRTLHYATLHYCSAPLCLSPRPNVHLDVPLMPVAATLVLAYLGVQPHRAGLRCAALGCLRAISQKRNI